MKKTIVLTILCLILLLFIYGGLLGTSYTLNWWWSEYVEKSEEQGIEFVAMARNDCPFPNHHIYQEYRLFAKRKWYYPYNELIDSFFIADSELYPGNFVPRAQVFTLDGQQYVAVFEKNATKYKPLLSA